MVKSTVIDAVNFLEQCLMEKGLCISRLILFGSQVAGKVTDDSDVDVLIVSDDFRGKDIFERAELTKQAEIMTIRKFLLPLDVITLTPEEFENEDSLVAEYAKNGEVIYVRQ